MKSVFQITLSGLFGVTTLWKTAHLYVVMSIFQQKHADVHQTLHHEHQHRGARTKPGPERMTRGIRGHFAGLNMLHPLLFDFLTFWAASLKEPAE